MQRVGPPTEIKNTGGRAGLGNDMLTLKHVDIGMPGGCLSGNVYPRGKNIPTVVPQEEVTNVLHIDLLNPQGSRLPLTDSNLGYAGLP